MFKDHGGADVARELIESSVKEVIALNNCRAKAQAGEYAEASRMLTEAALRLPNNLRGGIERLALDLDGRFS